MKKYEGLKFRFYSLGLTFQEFGFDNENEIPNEGAKGEILNISVEISDKFEDNYYDIKMENGEIIYSISGEHLNLM